MTRQPDMPIVCVGISGRAGYVGWDAPHCSVGDGHYGVAGGAPRGRLIGKDE